MWESLLYNNSSQSWGRCFIQVVRDKGNPPSEHPISTPVHSWACPCFVLGLFRTMESVCARLLLIRMQLVTRSGEEMLIPLSSPLAQLCLSSVSKWSKFSTVQKQYILINKISLLIFNSPPINPPTCRKTWSAKNSVDYSGICLLKSWIVYSIMHASLIQGGLQSTWTNHRTNYVDVLLD